MSSTLKNWLVAGGFTVLLLSVWIVGRPSPAQQVFGSVSQGSDYQSTSSPVIASSFPAISLLSGTTTSGIKTSGALANVTITKTDTGTMCFYDATTTDINKRNSNMATSSITIACFAASPTAGTYTFDASYYNGLTLVTTSPIASSTITWR